MSVIAPAEAAGKVASRTSFARCDCGSLVGFPSVVRAPPSSAPIVTNASSVATIQAPIVHRGCVVLASASLSSLVCSMTSLPYRPQLIVRGARWQSRGAGPAFPKLSSSDESNDRDRQIGYLGRLHAQLDRNADQAATASVGAAVGSA